MGFLDFLLGAAIAMNVLDTHDPKRPQDTTPADDDDYVGDGLDGTDDYVGDGLDGDDDDYDEDDPE